MIRTIRTWAGAAALLLFAACAGAPSAPTQDAFAPALFVARDADSTLYLFGTVHVRRPGGAWGGADAQAALAEAEDLWTELDMGPDMQARVQSIMVQEGIGPEPLSSRMTQAEYASFAALTMQFGVPARNFEPMRPWLAALTLSVLPMIQAGYDPNAGVDHVLASETPETVRRRYFETPEQQIGFFANMSDEAQMQFLRDAINEAQEGVAVMDALSEAWARGDLQTLERMVIDEFRAAAPDVYDVIFTQRNRAWTETLMTELEGEGVDFVAVGAGHMLGEDGLVAMLRARGVNVERVR
jgi:hypothetical protein